MKLNAVFEGGGVKGIGLVGALSRVEETGAVFSGLGGTSAGSMVAALCAAGYTAAEMKKVFFDLDFRTLLDPSWPKWYDLWKHKGIYKGERFYEWLYKLLDEKGVLVQHDFCKFAEPSS